MNTDKKIDLIKKHRKLQDTYNSNYCQKTDYDNYTIFRDDNLKDKFYHNFTFIKEDVPFEDSLNIINNQLNDEKYYNQMGFLNIAFHPLSDFNKEKIEQMGFEYSPYVCMWCDINTYHHIGINDEIIIKPAKSEKDYADSLICSLTEDDKYANFDFKYRDFYRRRNPNIPNGQFYHFVAYKVSGNIQVPVGKCEIFMVDNMAYIEGVVTIPQYRKNKVCSTVMTKAVDFCKENYVENLFLYADKDDTPQHLYEKMGFETFCDEHWALKLKK